MVCQQKRSKCDYPLFSSALIWTHSCFSFVSALKHGSYQCPWSTAAPPAGPAGISWGLWYFLHFMSCFQSDMFLCDPNLFQIFCENLLGTKIRSVCGGLTSCLPQMNTWCVFVKALNASRPRSATVPSASRLLKSVAVGLCSSAAVWKVRKKSVCSAPQLHLSIRPSSAAPRTGATATPPAASCCLCSHQVVQQSVTMETNCQIVILI